MSGASELVEGREVFDPFLNKTVKVSDKLTDRLRGRYAIGPTMDKGTPALIKSMRCAANRPSPRISHGLARSCSRPVHGGNDG